jgi:hypothetical protein
MTILDVLPLAFAASLTACVTHDASFSSRELLDRVDELRARGSAVVPDTDGSEHRVSLDDTVDSVQSRVPGRRVAGENGPVAALFEDCDDANLRAEPLPEGGPRPRCALVRPLVVTVGVDRSPDWGLIVGSALTTATLGGLGACAAACSGDAKNASTVALVATAGVVAIGVLVIELALGARPVAPFR